MSGTNQVNGLTITPIKDDEGNIISFTVSGGTNLKSLLDKFSKENCEHDYDSVDVEGMGTVYICKKCGEKDYD